jgi:hypothetical protein
MPGALINLSLLLLTSAGLSGAALTIGTYALAGALAVGISVGTPMGGTLITGGAK